MEIDFEESRATLMNYFGVAMMGSFPMAITNFSEVENASDSELIRIAEMNGFDLEDYMK